MSKVINNIVKYSNDIDKDHIINLFFNNVKDKDIILNNNIKHDGMEGHWLENQMNIKPNSKNEPDINGYEMKKNSKKITIGDYSATEYLFSQNKNIINKHNGWTNDIKISRNDFIKFFGNPNPKKNNRYSWSGKCVPKYNEYNDNGQILKINNINDIMIEYCYSKDIRTTKNTLPIYLQKDNILIAIWSNDKMKQNIENKFNKKGFFICKKNGEKYDKICFGKPFNFEHFINCIKNKKIIFDSGMYIGNTRNYSHFRGTNFWYDLITEEY